ncbi:6-hydroxymethylpterin diphosphokinase MptE-like protein [Halovenus sp. HT40]|uniref:6-hydroxymethylpterin diphosphokinase MptE-like protein n=1 Tax=Halovenus sp. HT40 TaxID=3126691 RepID=UPI00300EC745
MDFADWEPVYEQILADFGYGRDGDKQARDRLATLLDSDTFEPSQLDFGDETVAIAGGAGSLTEQAELVTARNADTVVAASIAADRLREHGIAVDCMVTDLDKNPDTVRELTEEDTPVAVHAHGDNVPTLSEWIPTLDAEFVIPTTQAEPADGVRNFGGFTDGDRAAFFADALGAAELVFPGWAFDDPTVSTEKRHKLQWAERLLYWLERRRSERFGVLDGRRDAIDTAGLPVE